MVCVAEASMVCAVVIVMMTFVNMGGTSINVMRRVDDMIRGFSIHVIVDVNVVKSE